MSSVLVDNWMLECAYNNLYVDIREEYEERFSHSNILDLSWANFLTALVFWDELWYINNNVSTWIWKGKHDDLLGRAISTGLSNFPSFVYSDFKLLGEIIRPINLIDYFHSDNELMFIENDGAIQEIDKRAEGYLAIGNAMAISYLPHSQRASHIYNLFSDKIRFFRIDILKNLDKHLNEFYDAINKEIGRSMLLFKYPVVYDYIRNECQNYYEELHFALELRNNNKLLDFKQSIFDIEISANSGNIQALCTCINTTKEISKEVLSKLSSNCVEFGTISLGLSPSLDIPMKIQRKKNAFHTSFLKDIVQFGISHRK